jgi:hypothetical protein
MNFSQQIGNFYFYEFRGNLCVQPRPRGTINNQWGSVKIILTFMNDQRGGIKIKPRVSVGLKEPTGQKLFEKEPDSRPIYPASLLVTTTESAAASASVDIWTSSSKQWWEWISKGKEELGRNSPDCIVI